MSLMNLKLSYYKVIYNIIESTIRKTVSYFKLSKKNFLKNLNCTKKIKFLMLFIVIARIGFWLQSARRVDENRSIIISVFFYVRGFK